MCGLEVPNVAGGGEYNIERRLVLDPRLHHGVEVGRELHLLLSERLEGDAPSETVNGSSRELIRALLRVFPNIDEHHREDVPGVARLELDRPPHPSADALHDGEPQPIAMAFGLHAGATAHKGLEDALLLRKCFSAYVLAIRTLYISAFRLYAAERREDTYLTFSILAVARATLYILNSAWNL